MDKKDEALKMAIKAIKEFSELNLLEKYYFEDKQFSEASKKLTKAYHVCKEALEQPAQEPRHVGWAWIHKDGSIWEFDPLKSGEETLGMDYVKLYTHSKQPSKEKDWVMICKKCGDELGIVYEPEDEIGDAEIKQMLNDIEYYQKRVEELEEQCEQLKTTIAKFRKIEDEYAHTEK